MTDFEALAESAVDAARKAGASYAEARAEHGVEDSLLLKNGNPEISGHQVFRGISVRVLAGGALGFASTNDLKPVSVKNAAAVAVRLAKASSKRRKTPIKFSDEPAHTDKVVLKPKRPLEDVPPEERLDYLLEIEKRVPKDIVVPARFFVVHTEVATKVYRNSDGSALSQRIPRTGMFAVVTVLDQIKKQTEQSVIQLGKAAGWEYLDSVDMPQRVEDEIRSLAKVLAQGEKCPEEMLDIVIGPEISGLAAHESCGHPFEADRILGREGAQAGESYVKPDSIGTRVGSEAVTIIDDPTVQSTYGWYCYDDEGVKARPRVLIKNGLIEGLLHNRDTGATFGTGSNGASRSSFYSLEPIIRMSNTCFQPGDHSPEELIEGVKRGVYIKTYNEWNIDDRRFNQKYTGREAYLIENGKLGKMIRRPVIELTTPAFHSAVDAAGKDLERTSGNCGKGDPMQGLPVDFGGPSLRLRNIRLRSGVA